MKSDPFSKFVESEGRLLPGSPVLSEFLKLRPGMKLLDIGCGRGEKTMFYGSKGVDSYGFDYSLAAIKIGRAQLAFLGEEQKNNMHLLRNDIVELPFKDGCFDRVTSWSVLEHIFPWQQEKLFLEIYRILKPEGVFVFETHPCEWFEKYGEPIVKPFKQILLGRKLESHAEREALQPEHVNLKNPYSVRKDLRNSGFACRTRLARRGHFEVDKGIARTLGVFLESIPMVNMIFRNNICGVAAKSKVNLENFDGGHGNDVILAGASR